jgi:hypothetical protein
MLPFSVAWHWEGRGVGRGYDCIVNLLSSPPRASSQMIIKIAKCDPGQSLLSCLNAQYRRNEAVPDACKAGNAVGVEIACNFLVQDVC